MKISEINDNVERFEWLIERFSKDIHDEWYFSEIEINNNVLTVECSGDCYPCRGTGYVERKIVDENGDYADTIDVKCDDCYGTGAWSQVHTYEELKALANEQKAELKRIEKELY